MARHVCCVIRNRERRYVAIVACVDRRVEAGRPPKLHFRAHARKAIHLGDLRIVIAEICGKSASIATVPLLGRGRRVRVASCAASFMKQWHVKVALFIEMLVTIKTCWRQKMPMSSAPRKLIMSKR